MAVSTKRKRSDQTHDRSKRAPSGAAVLREDVTASLRRALFEEWARTGYDALSLERVANRAGVGKAALYRRWSSKSEFAADSLRTIALSVTPVPDTGSLEDDIRTLLRAVLRLLRSPVVRAILPDLHAHSGRNGELAPVQAELASTRRKRAEQVIDRAVGRGELSGSVDRELCLDLLAAPLYWRLVVVSGACGRARLERLVSATLAALRATV
ncbi:MAG: TetR/AcrR family transcriptional regulator [Nannocystaceae bacterium]|nr:TetR/AcrR family transcriptional regulator [Nannocystaceae bacterium]